MARPKKKEKKVQYTIMIEPSKIQEIKEIAERAEMPPGTLARNLLFMGLDEMRVLDKAGLIWIVGFSRRKKEEIKKKFNIVTELDDTEDADE